MQFKCKCDLMKYFPLRLDFSAQIIPYCIERNVWKFANFLFSRIINFLCNSFLKKKGKLSQILQPKNCQNSWSKKTKIRGSGKAEWIAHRLSDLRTSTFLSRRQKKIVLCLGLRLSVTYAVERLSPTLSWIPFIPLLCETHHMVINKWIMCQLFFFIMLFQYYKPFGLKPEIIYFEHLNTKLVWFLWWKTVRLSNILVF
jgi:hypothetical protein